MLHNRCLYHHHHNHSRHRQHQSLIITYHASSFHTNSWYLNETKDECVAERCASFVLVCWIASFTILPFSRCRIHHIAPDGLVISLLINTNSQPWLITLTSFGSGFLHTKQKPWLYNDDEICKGTYRELKMHALAASVWVTQTFNHEFLIASYYQQHRSSCHWRFSDTYDGFCYKEQLFLQHLQKIIAQYGQKQTSWASFIRKGIAFTKNASILFPIYPFKTKVIFIFYSSHAFDVLI